MKRAAFILIMCMMIQVVMAQCLNRWQLRVGELRTYDQVLSDQAYKGVSVALRGLHIGNYKRASKNVFWSFFDNFRYSQQMNSSESARMHYMAVTVDFGTHYAFDLGHGFKLSLGGTIDAYGALKYVPRNVNNLTSADLQLALTGALTAHYKYKVSERFSIGCHYAVMTPMLGCFFSPDFGESYYEIWQTLPESLEHDLHFSSFHNRQGVNGEFDFDFIFRTGVLTVGFHHENEWWQASGNHFWYQDLGGTIGFALRLASIKPY